MKSSWFFFILPLALLVGCSAPASSPVPTAYPPEYVPTVIAMTAEAANRMGTEVALALTPSAIPSSTPRPTRTAPPQPTFTQTTIPSHNPAAIQIFAPGPMSKVVSPITLRMNIVAGASEKMQVDLYGEDGRLLGRILKNVPTSGRGVPQQISIPFEIRATAEVGRITVSTTDEVGRIQSLNSVRVLLLSSGNNEITPPGNPSEPVGVFAPLPEESVFGGVLNLRGDVWPFNLNPVIFELVGPEGRSLGLRIINVDHLNPQMFETTIPYNVTEPTTARLVIRQDDDRIEGLFYLYSQEVLLNP